MQQSFSSPWILVDMLYSWWSAATSSWDYHSYYECWYISIMDFTAKCNYLATISWSFSSSMFTYRVLIDENRRLETTMGLNCYLHPTPSSPTSSMTMSIKPPSLTLFRLSFADVFKRRCMIHAHNSPSSALWRQMRLCSFEIPTCGEVVAIIAAVSVDILNRRSPSKTRAGRD